MREILDRPPNLSDFIEWDVRNWSEALEFWKAHHRQPLAGCRALEIGSRHGGLALWMALQGARVVCSDVDMPSQNAVERHKAFGVSDRIEYRAIDATNIPYENEFDVVLFKSVLGAVGRFSNKEGQARAIAQMHRALRQGGELFFAENLVGSWLHDVCRKRFVRWGATWRYVTTPEMLSLLEPFSEVHHRAVGFAGAFGRTEGQRNFLGALDRGVFELVVPEQWKYIIVGVARK